MNDEEINKDKSIIAPWLSVNDGEKAVTFYKAAFNAIETYRLDNGGEGLVVRLSINGAEFWISGEAAKNDALPNELNGNIRLILITKEPDALFNQSIKAGAIEIFPVGEDYGWRLGRVADPFGLHWEIGYQL